MNELFIKVINTSISASWIIVAVLILRLLLRKAPKRVPILLWGMVAVRLLCPWTIESSFSLIPNTEAVTISTISRPSYDIQSGITSAEDTLNDSIENPHVNSITMPVNDGLNLRTVLTRLWLIGMMLLLAYAIISYCHLLRKIDTAILYRDNIFQSENIDSPFTLGMIRPRIYLPFAINEQDLEHVVAHEQTHISHKDHWWKPLGFLLLTIHWFNPLMWLAYILLCHDIELACDESVIKKFDNEQKADYTQALLACSINQRVITPSPLAFAEINVKERIKSVMNYKKPTLGLMLLSILACAIVAICFLTNRKQETFDIKIRIPAGSTEAFVYSDEIISPTGNKITISSGKGLGDTAVVLKPITVKEENTYEAVYLTPGMPVEMDVEPDASFYIGVAMQNESDLDREVFVKVKGIKVNEQEADSSNLEQYRTEYIGDASKVSKIAQNLPYPKNYSYSSIELQTTTEPYELIVYLVGEDNVQPEEFEHCASTAFHLIGNMGIVSFYDANSKSMIASFPRMNHEENMKYYLTIGAKGVTSIRMELPNSSGGCSNADGSPFKKGERIWLDNLDGLTDLRGLTISALNKNEEIVWSTSIPDEENNKGLTHLTQDGWTLTNMD